MRITVSFKDKETAKKTLQTAMDELDTGMGMLSFEVDGYSPDSTSSRVNIGFMDEDNDEFEEPFAVIEQGD